MGVSVNINIGAVDTLHNVYTGLTASGTTDIVCSDIIDTCNFNVDETTILQNHIYVRISCIRCNDQIYKVKINGQICDEIMCETACCDYTLTNNTRIGQAYIYTDCNNVTYESTLPDGETLNSICVDKTKYFNFFDNTLTLNGCCNN